MELAAAHGPIYSINEMAYTAQDSTSMVLRAWYNPLAVTRPRVAFRRLLSCTNSRATIISVRRTLSEIEIENSGVPKLAIASELERKPTGRELW